MNYNRLENEDLHTYALRLYENKSEYGLNSESIAELLNKETGKNYGESTYRKFYSAYKKGIEYAIAHNSNDTDIEEKLRELKSERVKLQTEKSEYNNMIRKESRQELFYENIAKAIQKLPVPSYRELPIVPNNKKAYVLTIADIHCGAEFEIEKNNYSFEECERRFDKLEAEMIDYIHKNNIATLKVLNLGDNVQGILRMSDLKLNQTSVVEATVVVARLISQFLNNLSVHCNIEYYSTPTSNHTQTRNLGSDRNGLKDEDVEFVIANYIKDVLINNKRVHCYDNFGCDYIEFPILNQNAVSLHGHTVKIGSALKDITFHNRRFYDYLFVAHLHAAKESVDGATSGRDVETLLAPSFIGTCPYADGLMKASQPSCKVFTFDEVNGHTDTHKILLKGGV